MTEDKYWKYLFVAALIVGIIGAFLHQALVDPTLTAGRKYKQDRGDAAAWTLLFMIATLLVASNVMKYDKKVLYNNLPEGNMCLGMLDEFNCKGCGEPMLQEQGVCFKCGRIVFETNEDTQESAPIEMTTQ